MNLVLIGYRATGKTSVARRIGERLGWPWFDADALVESRAGKSIARIFAEDGETVFRDLESQVVTELAHRDRSVLALGGGAVVRPANRRALGAPCKVVWLTASPQTIWQRILADATSLERRPNLTAQGGITEIIATLDARNPIYRQCSHLEVDTEGKTPDELADAILAQLDLR